MWLSGFFKVAQFGAFGAGGVAGNVALVFGVGGYSAAYASLAVKWRTAILADHECTDWLCRGRTLERRPDAS